VELDDLANRKAARLISLTDSACAVQVLPCQEDLQIARHTAALVLSGAKTLEDRPFASPLES
jgi:acetate kinase